MTIDRRSLLTLGAAAALLPPALQRALGAPASPRTGTIEDVEHVVIFMQENRSFDHYFGSLRGVRGFDDPRAIALPGGKPVWQQPREPGAAETVAPFHLDTKATFAQGMNSLDHSWKKSFHLWKHHDAWIPVKGEMTMGYFTRTDLPFYYALADAFTICDAYHCSIFGPTNPNRLFLWTGTSGLSVGYNGNDVIDNPPDANEGADIAKDTPSYKGLAWTTYAERLETAGVSWRVYQEYDNYGDNALAYFQQYRGGVPHGVLHEKARSWVAGSTEQNAKASRGEHLVAAFADDVTHDRLPQVSWIVAPTIMCEHPQATPGYGESLTWRLLEALASNPAVFAKTAFILNYDENDGFFDHVPPPVPPLYPQIGVSTVDMKGESYLGEPVGFGPRVPLIIVSPWTRGGFVNSQLSDHTSVLRFLETRFGVHEPNISAWRRALAGDLTSMFDFTQSGAWPAISSNDPLARTDAQSKLPAAQFVQDEHLPRQEPGQRPARPLPYDLEAAYDGGKLTIVNRGSVGAGFVAFSPHAGEGPWFYTVEAGKTLTHAPGAADLSVYGPNGFLREFHGAGPTVALSYDPKTGSLRIDGANLLVQDAYSPTAPGASIPLAERDHWYDVTVTSPHDKTFRRRLAGHVETGRPSKSDPQIGRA
ncbi:MAG TPA: phospholipase C, phosphocholine-specific [Rhizomicrobium sp.]|jgi:phospholipase C|nr:phospholipase C, phosphocholine-specific [Rhizomicrobium sp.]